MSTFDIDAAVGLMNSAPSTPGISFEEPDDAVALPPEPAEGDAPASEGTEGDAVETTASDDVAAMDDTATTDTPPAAGETKDGTADQGALPIIEPPSSWKAEEKDVFKSLPRAAQEAIARREQDRTTELRNLQNTTAAEKQAVAAEANRLKGLTSQIDTLVNTQVAELTSAFPDVKTEADVVALAAANPARFAVFQAKLMALNATQRAQESAKQEVLTRDTQANTERLAVAKNALLDAFPTWKDPTVGQREVTELQDYAITLGVPEQAARQTLDPFVYKLAQKAMLYDRAQAAKAAAVDRTPPRTPVKPGSGGTGGKGERSASDRAAQLGRLGNSGSIEDAVGLLRL